MACLPRGDESIHHYGKVGGECKGQDPNLTKAAFLCIKIGFTFLSAQHLHSHLAPGLSDLMARRLLSILRVAPGCVSINSSPVLFPAAGQWGQGHTCLFFSPMLSSGHLPSNRCLPAAAFQYVRDADALTCSVFHQITPISSVSVLRHACHYSSLVILTPPGPLTPGLLHCQQSDPNFHTMVQPMCLEHILEIIEDPLGLANSQFPATTPLWQDLLSFEEPSQPQWLEQCVSSSKIVPPPPEPSPEPIPLQQQDFRITATVPPQPRRPSKGHDKKDECKIFSPEFRQHSEECNRRPQGRLWSIWSTVFQPSRVVFSVAATGDRSPTFCRVNTTFEDVFGFTQEDLQSCTLQDKLVGPATDQQGLMDLWRFVDEDELPGDPRPLQLYSKSKQCLDSYVALNLLTDPRSDHGIQLVLMTVVGITALGYLDEPEHLAEFDRQKHPAPKRKRKRQQPSTAVERATCPWVAEASPRPRAQPAQYPSA